MTYPDRENTLALLTDWQKHHAAVQKLMDGIEESIGLDPNAPLFDTVWRLFDAYTAAIAVEVGDFGEWMKWYQAENEMGARGIIGAWQNPKTQQSRQQHRNLKLSEWMRFASARQTSRHKGLLLRKSG